MHDTMTVLHPRIARPAALLALVFVAATATIEAQWPRQRSKLARTADGRVDLNAAAPRTPDGRPDLSGIWEQYGEFEQPKYLLNIAADLKPEDVPLQPWARELLQQRRANNGADHPGARCLPSGIPEKNAVPAPFKIIQMPELVVILYESRTIFRQVFTDGRALPPPDAQPTWQGYSIGRWDGDALVVQTAGFNGLTWLDMSGHPATDALRVTERFTRTSVGRMDLEVTIDDPKAYTRPWTVRQTLRLLPEDELIEHICEENNKAPAQIFGK
jgi:hypothetical protein